MTGLRLQFCLCIRKAQQSNHPFLPSKDGFPNVDSPVVVDSPVAVVAFVAAGAWAAFSEPFGSVP